MNKKIIIVSKICILIPAILVLQGCPSRPPAPDPEAQNELLIRVSPDGTKVVTDGTGEPLEQIKLENPEDPIASLAKMRNKKTVGLTHLRTPAIFTLRESPTCTCEFDGGYGQCSPRGCERHHP